MGTRLDIAKSQKDFDVDAFLYFNKDGYSTYCREYKEYWDWVGKETHIDITTILVIIKTMMAKNMMHCLRMLDMAIEIAEGKGVNLIRPNQKLAAIC